MEYNFDALSFENIVQDFRDIYQTNYMEEREINVEYIQQLLTPLFDFLNQKTTGEFYANLYKLPEKLLIPINSYINDNLTPERTNVNDLKKLAIYYTLNYIILNIFALTKNYRVLVPSTIFLAIFNNTELRNVIFHICPDDFPTKPADKNYVQNMTTFLIGNNSVGNKDSADVIAKVVNYIWYLNKGELFDFNTYMIKGISNINPTFGFNPSWDTLKDLIKIMAIYLGSNIDNKKWDKDEPLSYIASLYDNDYVDLVPILQQKLPTDYKY